MRVIHLLAILLFSLLGQQAFGKSTLDERMSKLKILQNRVEKECLKNPNAKNYVIELDGRKINCQELIVITNQLRIEIEKEVAELKSCEEGQDTEHGNLALQTGKILESSPVCKESPDKAKCAAQYTCTMMTAAVAPMGTFLQLAGSAIKSQSLKECGKQGNNCLLSVLRGIFDSIWSSLSLIWDGVKWVGKKTAELFGFVKKSEAATSERAMAAQQAGPSFIKQLVSHPIDTMKKLAKNLFSSLQTAAMEHYGCQKWAGIPFKSKCMAPMTTWDCATCGQKAQVYCGIAGYAAGEIGTALITGGLLAGGKVAITGAVKIAAGPARNVANLIGKTFPKAAKVSVNAGKKLSAAAKASLTAVERASIATWTKLANSSASKAIATAASAISKTTVAKVLGYGLKPIGAYLGAMDKAFMFGFNGVEKIAAGGAKARAAVTVTEEVARASKLADEAVGAKEATIKIAADQSKATPGYIVVETGAGKASKVQQSTKVEVPVVAPKRAAVEMPKATSSKVASSSEKSSEVGGFSKIADDDFDVVASISKYKNDDEYFKLFASPKMYDDYHNDLATVIATMERTQPNLSKAEIRKTIEKMMNSCDL